MDEFKTFDIGTLVTDSLIEVFDVMLSMELELADDNEFSVSDKEKITGTVGLGGKVSGCIMIQVSEKLSRIMTASMSDTEVDEIKDENDVKDVISEVCNIVAGNLKSNFCDIGLPCELSPPSFTKGNDFAIETLNAERYERYVFSHEKHNVVVEVGVKVNEAEDIAADKSYEQKAQPQKITVEMIDEFDTKTAIVDSTIEIFDMMLSMTIESSDKDLSDIEKELIVGSVSFVGPLTGSLQICVGRNFSRQMTSAMLGIKEEEVEGEDDIKDVISELCNIISGNIKSKFCDAGLACELSTPSFTRGSNFVIETQNMVKHESYSFLHQGSPVIVEISLKVGEQSDSSKKQGEVPGLQSAKFIDSQTMIDEMIDHEVSSEEDPQKAIDELIAAEAPSEDRPDSNEFAGQLNDQENSPVNGLKNNPYSDLYSKNLDIILDIPVRVSVEFGRSKKPISELVKIGQGSVVDFSNLAEEPLNIFVNQTLIAKGELLVKNEKYGIRILEIIDRNQRLQNLL